MSMKKMMTSGIVAGAVALAIAGAASSANAEMSADKEKCFGVVKAGQNDCGNATKTHSCMGHATADADGNEWIALPKGLCEKLAGGSLTPFEGSAKHTCEGKGSCAGKEMKEEAAPAATEEKKSEEGAH